MTETKKSTKPTEPHFDDSVKEYLDKFLGSTPEEDAEKQRQSDLETLRNSYRMYEQSKAEMVRVRSTKKDKYGNRIYSDTSIKKTLSLMETAQQDIKAKYLQLGGAEEDLIAIENEKKRIDRSGILKAIDKANKRDGIRAYVERGNKNSSVKKEAEEEEAKPFPTAKGSYTDFKSREVYEPESLDTYKASSLLYEETKPSKRKEEKQEKDMETQKTEKAPRSVKNVEPKKAERVQQDGIRVRENDGRAAYDTVNLPSKGECYSSKIKEVEVGFLTAYDENLILSPNLYRNGTFLDHMLKNKVKGIDTDELIQGDRDAIIIWLRASGYGNEYPVTVTDDKTGEEFDTIVDLSKLKYRKFKLVGDEEGYFSFTLPVTKDEVKFKFLTNKDTKKLREMQDEEDKQYLVATYNESLRKLRDVIVDNDLIDEEAYQKMASAINTLEENGEAYFGTIPESEFSHDLTNRLILSTVSVNGNRDRKYIVDYILNLNVKDAKAYREYILDNEPGIDYNIKVERPEDLGGGQMETFLRLDQFIFVPKV